MDLSLATKKYQRSSAGKTFEPEEVRSPDACLDTMLFLMDRVLEADNENEVKEDTEDDIFAIRPSYNEIYSYLHDRCRAVRVDLHLQQPWSSQTEAFITCHEYCFRFEVLSRFLFAKDAKSHKLHKPKEEGSQKHSQEVSSPSAPCSYDEHLGLQAISQTIDPLLAAYRDARDRGQPFETEPSIQRLVTWQPDLAMKRKTDSGATKIFKFPIIFQGDLHS